VRDLRHHGLDVDRDDVLVFAGDEHRGNSEEVDIRLRNNSWRFFEKSVHVLDRQEERLLGHLKSGQDLEHPVDHFGPRKLGDGVPGQMSDVVVVRNRPDACLAPVLAAAEAIRSLESVKGLNDLLSRFIQEVVNNRWLSLYNTLAWRCCSHVHSNLLYAPAFLAWSRSVVQYLK